MYELTGPSGVRSLVLQGPFFGTKYAEDDNAKLLSAMPRAEKVVRDHVQSGFTSCPEHAAALHEFYKKHLCRVDPWPDDVHRIFSGMGTEVLHKMWGAAELSCNGDLSGFDITEEVRNIDGPTLFIGAEFDQCSPETMRHYQDCIPGSELLMLGGASHLPNLERPPEFHAAVRAFIRRFD
jgi:proline iminopeptidase